MKDIAIIDTTIDNIVNLKSHTEAQESPCPFGTFCIIYNGEIVAHHPISKGRFVNIMNKITTERGKQ